MALPAGVPDSLEFRLMYGLLLFISFFTALTGKQAYRRLATSHTQLKTENNFTNQMWLTTLRCWERLHRDTTRYASQVSHRTRQLEAQLHPHSHPPTKAQLMTDNAVLHQYTYQLDVTNKHLTQVLHQAQQPMTLAIASKALTAIWKEALQTLYQHKRSTIVITQSHTACQILCADLRKIQRLLLNGLTHLASPVHDKCLILLGLEDTQLAYPIVSLPEYIKYVKAVRITMTTEKVLPRLKQWYLGSVDHAETQYPQDITAVSIAHNQQIVEAHYGFAEITTHKDGVRLVYVIPWDVRAVRPPIMDQQHGATTAATLETSVHPSEEAFIQAVHDAHNPIDETLLKQSIQLTKQYYGRIKSATSELCYLQAMAVARIVLGYTNDADTLLAALLHDVIDKTHYSLHHIALCFNPVVKRIVEGVTSVDSRLSSFKKIHLSAHEIRRKLSEVEDDRILLIKLADRLHNLRTIAGHSSLDKQKTIAEETLQFFVPIAKGLRLMPMAEELKKRCLVVLSRK